MSSLLYERRHLEGRAFLTLGRFHEYPNDSELDLLTDVFDGCIGMHGGWSHAYVTVPEDAVDIEPPIVKYPLLTVPRNATLVRARNKLHVRDAVHAGWRVLRPLVLCGADVPRVDVQEFLDLDRKTEVPSARLMACTSFLALRWFHPSQVDLHSSEHDISELVSIVRQVAVARGVSIDEAFEHF